MLGHGEGDSNLVVEPLAVPEPHISTGTEASKSRNVANQEVQDLDVMGHGEGPSNVVVEPLAVPEPQISTGTVAFQSRNVANQEVQALDVMGHGEGPSNVAIQPIQVSDDYRHEQKSGSNKNFVDTSQISHSFGRLRSGKTWK